jgi:hypothetical protein
MDQKEYISMFVKYIEIEKNKIEIDKWRKGVELNKDPGDQYIIEWIEKNASWFRESWDNSNCKYCIHWKWCGWKVEKDCSGFIPNQQ